MKALAKSFKTQILLGNKVYIAIPHGPFCRQSVVQAHCGIYYFSFNKYSSPSDLLTALIERASASSTFFLSQ